MDCLKFFSVDSPLYRFMDGLKNMFLLNLCWLIGSLPIVTIGISTVAAFDVALRMADNEEGYVMRQYFKAYKANWKQGLPLGLLMLTCAYVLYLDVQIVAVSKEGNVGMLIAACVSAFVFVFSLLYAFALTARYENTLPKILHNSFRISMKYFFRSVFTLAIVGLEIAVFLWNYTTMFVGVLLGFGLIIYSVAVMAKPVFKKIEKDTAAGE